VTDTGMSFRKADLPLALLLQDPRFFPLRIDWQERVIHFVNVTKHALTTAAFVDDRLPFRDKSVYTCNLDDVILHGYEIPRNPRAPAVILHTAFCCSTLLCRYLECVPTIFVLKEPYILMQLGIAQRMRQNKADKWLEIYRASIALINRSFDERQQTIIKVNDLSNSLWDVFLHEDPGTAILCLSLPVRAFLRAALKSQYRRQWVKARLKHAKRAPALKEFLAEVDISQLPDAEACSLLWFCYLTLFRKCKEADPSRVVMLSGEIVANKPEAAVLAASDCFGLGLRNEQIESMVSSSVGSQHSKVGARPYTSSMRLKEAAEVEKRLSGEIAKGCDYAQALMRQYDCVDESWECA
jgi:hypothetical protein